MDYQTIPEPGKTNEDFGKSDKKIRGQVFLQTTVYIDITVQMSTSDETEDVFVSPSSEDRLYMQKEATEELNAVFQLLKMEKIRDNLVFFAHV